MLSDKTLPVRSLLYIPPVLCALHISHLSIWSP